MIFAPEVARMTRLVSRSIACTIILILPACTALPRAEFTAREQQIAEVPGFKGVRTWADSTLEDFKRNGVALLSTDSHSVRYLALSSGGSGGAFGAGVLVGWTASGSRPVFDLVSGVSTGALIAPFAFLGSEYDRTLAEIYASDVAGDVVQMQFLPAGLFGSGILQPEPLRRLVEKYADERLLVAIAGEHRKGRRLLVVTTNMDAQRAVVWDMGKIAASGRFEALKLFRDILADAGINRRLIPGLHRARQDQTLAGCAGHRCYHRYGRYGLFPRPLRDFRFVTAPLQYSERRDRDCGKYGNQTDPA